MSVRHTLLGLIAQQPRYGYELRAAFTALAGGRENWNVTPAQIYTTLNRMQAAGLICEDSSAADTSSEKRFYALTPAGREVLEDWFNAQVNSAPQQDEFHLKLMLGRSLEFVNLPRLIQSQRSSLYQELHRITTQRQSLDPNNELAHILLMDKAIMHLEADLRWLDMVEARLEDVQKQPAPEPDLRPRGRPTKNLKLIPLSRR